MAKKKPSRKTPTRAAKRSGKTARETKPATGRKNKRKTATKRAASPARRAQAGVVRVRMYDVGFGDAFMLWIPAPDRDRKILIDCGSVAARKTSMDRIVDTIIDDATEADGIARIDVVVATHRHRDHVSGFTRSDWRRVHVREVWMPWTEDPNDREASRIRNAQARLAFSLHTTLCADGAPEHYQQMALNALTNEEAMDTLHNGFAGPPKRYFLPESSQASDEAARSRFFTTDALPDTAVYVLGPSRDADAIQDMDPPAGESYLRLINQADGASTTPTPFSSDWTTEPTHPISPSEADYIKAIGDGAEMDLAVSLDAAVNGTSLMLVLRVGKAHLLFPGDAQWGTWRAALNDPQWSKLLSKIQFYKVGHHGSHNATPVEFVETTLAEANPISAMVSVRPRPALWPNIPRKALLDALRKKKARVSRSDQARQPAGFKRHEDLWIETTIPTD